MGVVCGDTTATDCPLTYLQRINRIILEKHPHLLLIFSQVKQSGGSTIWFVRNLETLGYAEPLPRFL